MIEQRTPEWHNQRRSRVTGSVVGAILGLSPYMTRADVMRRMVRDAIGAELEFVGNVATEYGTGNEAGALVEFQMETGLSVLPAPFVPLSDWLGASPDGYTSDGGLVEVKCPYGLRKDADPIFKSADEQPHYHAQMQVQMYCTGKMHCWFYQWAPRGTRTERVDYSPVWINDNLPALRQFHAEYLDELRENATEYLAPKRVEIDTPEAAKMVAEWDQINEQLELLAERKKDLLADMVAVAHEKDALFAGRKLTLAERQGTVAYARVVKEHLAKLDLEPYRGKPSRYWQVR